MTTPKVLLLAIAAITAAAMLPGNALARKDGPEAVKIDDDLADVALGMLSARSMLETAASDSPLLDTTGEHCHKGRHGKLLFLAGSPDGEPVSRKCVIEPDTIVIVPVQTWVYLHLDKGPIDSRAGQFLKRAERCLKKGKLRVAVNGRKVPPSRIHHDTGGSGDNGSETFTVDLPSLGRRQAKHMGAFAAFERFGKGQHTITWQAQGCDGLALDNQDVTYALIGGDG